MLEICRLVEKIPTLLEVSLFFVSLENLRSRPRHELDPLFSAGHHFLSIFYEDSLRETVELRWVGMYEKTCAVDSLLYAGFIDRVRHLNRPNDVSRKVNILLGYDVQRDIENAINENGSFSYDALEVNRPIDLIVRSGGYQRLSGFLPLMCQYAEFDFIEKLFPDVTLQDITDSIGRFGAANRRFGT